MVSPVLGGLQPSLPVMKIHSDSIIAHWYDVKMTDL